MPEGDTIHRTATRLQPLVGRRITAARAHAGPGLRHIPDLSRIVGASVTAVEARGKHLLIGFDNGLTLRSHLRMTGSWRLYRSTPPARASAILETDDLAAVAFRTPVLELLTDAGLRRSPLAMLGPDLLHPSFDAGEALRRLRERSARELGDALLDQRAVAGIGNVYKSELAFLAGLDPWAPVAAFSDEELQRVLRLGQRVLAANVRGSGPRTTTGRRGEALWVYGRTGRPCRRCGTAILGRRQGDGARMTYWCPHCQPARATPRSG